MKILKIEDLIVGATYLIDSQDGDHSWIGHARLIEMREDGRLVFSHPEKDEMLIDFSIGDVVKLVEQS